MNGSIDTDPGDPADPSDPCLIKGSMESIRINPIRYKSVRKGSVDFCFALGLLIFANQAAFATEGIKYEAISFELPSAPLTPFRRSRISENSINSDQGIFQARLRIPNTLGKTPAVVLIHTCHGEAHYISWIKRLNNWGFATLSFSRCQPPDNIPDSTEFPSLDWWRGVIAANGALKYLKHRPEINPDAIVLMAWSRLGIVPLSVMNPEGFSQFVSERFVAAIALYPFCSFARGPHNGPILVLSAGRDDWVDTNVCVRMGRETQNDPYPVRVEVLTGAEHGFDIEAHGVPHLASRAEINPDEFAAGAGTIGYSESATQTAVALIQGFLQQHVPR